jgi:hypothetical protein
MSLSERAALSTDSFPLARGEPLSLWVENPTAILEPLSPGERVLWSGQPTLLPSVAALRHATSPLGFWVVLPVKCLLTAASMLLFVLIVAFNAYSLRRGFDLRVFLVVTTIFAAPAYVVAVQFLRALVVRKNRRYVVTTKTVLVVDPSVVYSFPSKADSLKVSGQCLVSTETPTLLGRGPWPWKKRRHPRAALYDLADAKALVTEIRRASPSDVTANTHPEQRSS